MIKRGLLGVFLRIFAILLINLLFILGGNTPIFAACGDAGFVGPCPETSNSVSNSQDDLTKSTYMLNLENLSPMNTKKAPGGKEAVKIILSSASSLLLFILPIIAAISLIVAGYYYILSSGDSEKASQAKTIIKWNVIAILVALFSYAIIQLVASVLGGNI